MSNHQFVIRVKGNIKIKEGIHYTQGCGAFGIGSLEQCSEMDMLIGTGHLVKSVQFVFNENEQSVDSDLIVDRNTRLIPYAYYVADKGFMDHSGLLQHSYQECPGYYPAIHCYRNNIDEMKRLLTLDINTDAEEAFCRGLFLQVFSILELFLSDYMLCGIFNVDGCFERALRYFNLCQHKHIKENDKMSLCNAVNEIVFHRFELVDFMYGYILEKNFPEVGELQSFLKDRNNFAHRYVFSKKNHMQPQSINRQKVNRLIKACDAFVDAFN